jgi:beta-lactamase regulating signal transducer with metallopeptidase domain
MIAAWMAYVLVISLLVAIAAWTAERMALSMRKRTSHVWKAALLCSLLLPALFAWYHTSPGTTQATAAVVALATEQSGPVYAQSPIIWVSGGRAAVHVTYDSWLIALWAAATTIVLSVLMLGQLQLWRRLKSAERRQIEGVDVLASDDIGPAVVGIFKSSIVVPRWLFAADAMTQAITLAHEREHLRCHDVRFVGAAVLICALLPWNLPLWWQLRRLRFAMEVDCDDRVLRQGHDVSHYGSVLLNVATRLVPLRAAAASLTESGSLLEKRIRIMRTPVHKRWRATATFLALCCATLVAAAANVTVPDALPSIANSSDDLPLLPSPIIEQTSEEAALARVVAHFYPQLADQKQAGRAYIWAVLNEAGQVAQTAMELRPAWVTEAAFAENWKAYLQRTGIPEDKLTQRIVLQLRVGKNYIVVAWVMQPGAAAQDVSAPRFDLASKQVRSAEAQMLATVAAQRTVIEHFDRAALNEGMPQGQELWFLIDADGRVLKAGRRPTIVDPQTARLRMRDQFPNISVGYVTRGTAVKDATGKRVPVSWQWLERDSPLPRT